MQKKTHYVQRHDTLSEVRSANTKHHPVVQAVVSTREHCIRYGPESYTHHPLTAPRDGGAVSLQRLAHEVVPCKVVGGRARPHGAALRGVAPERPIAAQQQKYIT